MHSLPPVSTASDHAEKLTLLRFLITPSTPLTPPPHTPTVHIEPPRCNQPGEDQVEVWRDIAAVLREALLQLEAKALPNPNQVRAGSRTAAAPAASACSTLLAACRLAQAV